jgi:hypothetical protein
VGEWSITLLRVDRCTEGKSSRALNGKSVRIHGELQEMSTQPDLLLSEANAVEPQVVVAEPTVPKTAIKLSPSVLNDVKASREGSPNYRRLIMQGATSTAAYAIRNSESTAQLPEHAVSAESVHSKHELQQRRTEPTAETHVAKPRAGTWSSWWSSATSFAGGVLETTKSAIVGGYKVVCDVMSGAFTAGVSVAGRIISDPQAAVAKAFSIGKSALTTLFAAGKSIVTGVAKGVVWCINNPEKLVTTALSLVCSAVSAGWSLVVGLASQVWNGVKQVLRGEMPIGQALLNCFVFACELSGLADAWGCIKHGTLALAAYGRGDRQAALQHLGQLAMHGTFLGLALAFVSPAGVLAPVLVPLMLTRALIGFALKEGGKQVLKASTREFLECGSKKISESVLKKMGEPAVERLAQECPEEVVKAAAKAQELVGAGATAEALAAKTQELVLDRAIELQGAKISLTMGRSLSEDVTKAGAEQVLNPAYVKELGEKVGADQTKTFLEQLGLVKHVEDAAFELQSSMKEKSYKEARQYLIDTMGIAPKEAGKMAREVQGLIRSGKSDAAIKEVLEEHITKYVSENVASKMEGSFKETFRQGLRGELTDPDNAVWSKNLKEAVDIRAKQLGTSADELTDDLVKAGWEGVESGIKRATRQLVREGLERAFKRLRDGLRRPLLSSANEDGDITHNGHLDTKPANSDLRQDDGSGDGAQQVGEAGSSHEKESRTQVVVRGDGSTVEVKKTFEGERLVGQQEIVVAGPVAEGLKSELDNAFQPASFEGKKVHAPSKEEAKSGKDAWTNAA